MLKPADTGDATAVFMRSSADSNLLVGPGSWVGVIKAVPGVGSVISIHETPAAGKPVQQGATFVKGQLLSFRVRGADTDYLPGIPAFTDSLGALWPKMHARETTKGSKGDIWNGPNQRLRLWFVNPNSAGFLGTELALLFLILALDSGMWRRIIGVIGGLACMLIVAFAGSRGAMVALVAGAAVVVCVRGRKLLTCKGLLITVTCIVAIVAILGAAGQLQRIYGTFTGVDKGNSLRVKVAKASAQMFADAPRGWHGGEVPGRSACLNWYVTDEKHGIRTHLLSLAELGWIGGFGYLFFWALMLGMGLRWARQGTVLPLALWTAFSLAGCFNPVHTELSLWLLPVAGLGWGLLCHEEYRGRKLAFLVLGSGIVALAGVVSLGMLGMALNRGRDLSITSSGAATLVNGSDPKVWVVEDVPVLGGWNGFPGRDIQWQYKIKPDLPSLGYVYGIIDLPKEVDCLVLPGRAAADYLEAYANDATKVCRAKRILFLSPSVGPTAVPMKLLETSDVFWLAGKFLAYRDAGYGLGLSWVQVVSGAEQYIPNWLSISFRHFNLAASNKK